MKCGLECGVVLADPVRKEAGTLQVQGEGQVKYSLITPGLSTTAAEHVFPSMTPAAEMMSYLHSLWNKLLTSNTYKESR